MDAATATDVAEVVLAHHRERTPGIRVGIRNHNNIRTTEQFERDISDRITITDSDVPFTVDAYIEKVEHQVQAGAKEHTTWFDCDKVGAVQPPDTLILDDPTRGQLDEEVLGFAGIMDPDTIFILDSDTNGELNVNQIAY